MKQIIHSKYGSPQFLRVEDVPMPEPAADEVRVKVHFASVNATDFEIIRGDPIVRMASGIRRPKNPRLGCDLSGVVEAKGSDVTSFDIGDAVYVDLMYQQKAYGAFAEYVLVPEARLHKKPDGMAFEDAATYPQAGVLALQGIREPLPPQEGQQVLINGAGGGVGTFAVQIAKHYGAEVTAVDRSEKFQTLRQLGADHCIDYREADFTKLGNTYDIILDVIAKKGPRAYSRVLNENGRYRMVGGSLRKIIHIAFGGMIRSKFSNKSIGLLLGRPNDATDLKFLSELYEQGEVKPYITQIVSLEDVPATIQQLMDGEITGKAAVKIIQ